MSHPSSESKPPAPSQAKRYLVVLVLGIVLGVIGVVMALRALESSKTWQDRYPLALMQLMSAHAAQLGQKHESHLCTASDLLPHVQAMRVLGHDLEPAFTDLGTDRRFIAHASDFRATLDAILAAPPHTCEQMEQTRADIGNTCRACHQDFR